MADFKPTDINPLASLAELRRRLRNGASLLIEDLNDDELAAMNELLLVGEAEIVSSACRPYLKTRLERTII